MDDLVDSDFDVVDEISMKKEGRLKKKSKSRPIEYENDNEEDKKNKPKSISKIQKKQYKEEEYEEKEDEYSDNDDFIDKQGHNNAFENENRHFKKSIAEEVFGMAEENNENNEERNQSEIDVDHKLKKMFDEDEIEEEFETERDQRIIKTDCPERIQKYYKEEELEKLLNKDEDTTIELSKKLEYEAEWIIEKIRSYKQQNVSTAALKKKILTVLEYYKKDFYDIPFIVYYRRMFYETELNQFDIWKIFEFDKEFNKFMSYKMNVTKMFNSIKSYFKEDDKKLFYLEQKFLETAKTIKELNDLEAYFLLIREIKIGPDAKENSRHAPFKKSFIQSMSQTRFPEFAASFALSTYELAINLEMLTNGDSSKLIQPREPAKKPSTVAYDYTDLIYSQEILVLTNVCRYLSAEIANHPYIKSYVRKFFNQYATLTTNPTDEGKKELEALHSSYRVKRIIKKPIDSFDNDLYIDIIENDKKGFITYSISIEDNEMLELVNKISRAYVKAEISSEESYTEEWNLLRQEAIRIMIKEFLLPELKKEAHYNLLERAENYIIKLASSNFHSILSTGPYVKSIDKTNR